jgi:hypothetical protein
MLRVGQDTPNLEAPEVAAALLDDEIDHNTGCPFE